uniref:ORF51b n=1 Tax=Pinus koraiensis TaxID=88728 RepID=A4QMJ4_PINKO|nr:ORF51b [Pinus koraiensis]ABP35344.1 ORF51b [Pinus koraiensis]
MLYNLNHFNSEWSLSFSDQSYTEKTKRKKEKWVGWTKDRSVCYNQIVAGIV